MSQPIIRITQINQQNSHIIINNNNITHQSLYTSPSTQSKSYHIFIAIPLILITTLIALSQLLYSNPTTQLQKQLSKIQQLTQKQPNKRTTFNIIQPNQNYPKKQQIYQSKLNKSILQYYRTKTKKSSPNISMQKLKRSQQLYINLTQPIDPVYLIQQQKVYQQDYNLHIYPEKPICVVIPTYNNVKQFRYKINIDSILNQLYTNYRIIIIDDASPDNTSQQIQSYIQDNENYLNGKITIQKNPQRKMALANIIYAAKYFCKPQQIFIVIDGDDYLLGKFVFKLFNYGFSDPNTWVVYSNFLTINGTIGYSRPYPMQIIRDNQFRNVYFAISHLRAFYTKLFLLIDPQDLTDRNGNLFHAANDVSIFMPILQMSHHHILYLPQLTYFYNSNTGLNNHKQKKKQQIQNDLYIRNKSRYYPIKQLFINQDIYTNDQYHYL